MAGVDGDRSESKDGPDADHGVVGGYGETGIDSLHPDDVQEEGMHILQEGTWEAVPPQFRTLFLRLSCRGALHQAFRVCPLNNIIDFSHFASSPYRMGTMM